MLTGTEDGCCNARSLVPRALELWHQAISEGQVWDYLRQAVADIQIQDSNTYSKFMPVVFVYITYVIPTY